VYSRILVPLDGSKLAEGAVPYAVAQAERFDAEIVLLKVLGPLPEPAMAGRSVVRAAEERSAELAHQYLEGVAEPIRDRGIQVETLALEGKPYVEIISYAETAQIDLIVISTRGYSGLSRWLLGSVTDRVVRGATVPVLLVQSRGEPAT
jgi:nucleotide-binding universal stress UspA family protein